MIGSTKWVTLIFIYSKREIIHHLIKEFESPVIDWYTRITKETFCRFRNNSNCLHDQKPHSSFELLFHHPVTMFLPVVRRTDYCFLLDITNSTMLSGHEFFHWSLSMTAGIQFPHLLTFVWCHCKHMTSQTNRQAFSHFFRFNNRAFSYIAQCLCVNGFWEFRLTSHYFINPTYTSNGSSLLRNKKMSRSANYNGILARK